MFNNNSYEKMQCSMILGMTSNILYSSEKNENAKKITQHVTINQYQPKQIIPNEVKSYNYN
jgi:hypothetical protein